MDDPALPAGRQTDRPTPGVTLTSLAEGGSQHGTQKIAWWYAYNDVVFDLPAHLMHEVRRSRLSWSLGGPGGLAVVKSCSLRHTPGGAGLGHLGLAVDSSTPATYSRCHIGVARGALGARAPPGGGEKMGAKFKGESCKCTPRQKKSSIFRKLGRSGRWEWMRFTVEDRYLPLSTLTTSKVLKVLFCVISFFYQSFQSD